MVYRLVLKIGIAAALASAGYPARAAGLDPADVLLRAVRKARATAIHVPNYTCIETVERRYYRPAANTLPRACTVLMNQRRHPTPDLVLSLFSTDRLRLDVTLANRGEIFSWAGASHFVDGDIDQVVRRGPFGTGTFGAYFSDIFSHDIRSFTFRGAIDADRHSLFVYSFAFGLSESHFRVKADNAWVYHGYSGTFQVDPATADITRMVLVSAELPPAARICQIATTLDFGTVRIGDSPFQLPQHTRQRFILPDGQESENLTSFSECREYRGESTVTFAGAPAPGTGPSETGSAAPAALPPGLSFSLSLTEPIRTATAAAGDTFSARLAGPLRDFHHKVLAPKGAPVQGRLLRVQSFSTPPEVVVVLSPRSILLRRVRVPLRAVWMYDRRRRISKGTAILLPLPGEDNAGAFRFRGAEAVIPAGFTTDWRMAPLPSAAAR